MAAGRSVVAEQIHNIECDNFQCAGGKALATAALNAPPPVGEPMHVLPTQVPAPMPRPRPDRAG
jgi:hypothetical protein